MDLKNTPEDLMNLLQSNKDMDVQAVKQNAYNSAYIFLKILQQYDFKSDEIHFVFEGFDDQSFYCNYIHNINDRFVTHISYGKKQSMDLYYSLDWARYDKKRILIFIDRDYSRILGERVPVDFNVYETTFYSIENYICNRFVIRRLINEILHYHENTVIELLIDLYENEYQKFYNHLKPILSWILLIRIHGLKANLNQIDMDHVFYVDPDLKLHLRKINKIEYFERVTNVETPKVQFSELRNIYNIISLQYPEKLVLRGKYDLWFLVSFFTKINLYLTVKKDHKSKMKTFINDNNAVEIIGPRTPIPDRLHDFVDNIRTLYA